MQGDLSGCSGRAFILKKEKHVPARPLQTETLTCRHDDPSQNLPARVRGGEVVRQISELIQNQAGHSVGQHLGPQQGSGTSCARGHQGALPLPEGTGGFPPGESR